MISHASKWWGKRILSRLRSVNTLVRLCNMCQRMQVRYFGRLSMIPTLKDISHTRQSVYQAAIQPTNQPRWSQSPTIRLVVVRPCNEYAIKLFFGKCPVISNLMHLSISSESCPDEHGQQLQATLELDESMARNMKIVLLIYPRRLRRISNGWWWLIDQW